MTNEEETRTVLDDDELRASALHARPIYVEHCERLGACVTVGRCVQIDDERIGLESGRRVTIVLRSRIVRSCLVVRDPQ